MTANARIALIGDYHPQVRAHVAIPQALQLAADALACAIEPLWIATPSLDQGTEKQLSAFDAIWCVPNSPYASMGGALRAMIYHATSWTALMLWVKNCLLRGRPWRSPSPRPRGRPCHRQQGTGGRDR